MITEDCSSLYSAVAVFDKNQLVIQYTTLY